jgi:hypothetical protein
VILLPQKVSAHLPAMESPDAPAEIQQLFEHPAARELLVTPRRLTRAQRHYLNDSLQARRAIETSPDGTTDYISINASLPLDDRLNFINYFRLLGFGAAALFTLAVAGVGLALAARESDYERAVLDTVGASPRLRRKIGTRRAALLAAVAVAVAVPVGLLPIAATVSFESSTYKHFKVDPWTLGLALSLPVVVAVVASLGGWLRDLVRPRRTILITED